MGDDIRVTVVSHRPGKNEKAMQLVQTPMLRTGTHNAPLMASGAGLHASAGVTMGAASVAGHAAMDGMKQPAVWRREQASEQVQAMQRNGVETYDIPAFLRKQAD
jgi:cell division protein FtsZ